LEPSARMLLNCQLFRDKAAAATKPYENPIKEVDIILKGLHKVIQLRIDKIKHTQQVVRQTELVGFGINKQEEKT